MDVERQLSRGGDTPALVLVEFLRNFTEAV
jgi:hypothetical protein